MVYFARLWKKTLSVIVCICVLQRLAMDPRCKGMPLSSFLLKPMQRVTRYPLIIKNVSTHAHTPGLEAEELNNLPSIVVIIRQHS